MPQNVWEKRMLVVFRNFNSFIQFNSVLVEGKQIRQQKGFAECGAHGMELLFVFTIYVIQNTSGLSVMGIMRGWYRFKECQNLDSRCQLDAVSDTICCQVLIIDSCTAVNRKTFQVLFSSQRKILPTFCWFRVNSDQQPARSLSLSHPWANFLKIFVCIIWFFLLPKQRYANFALMRNL